LNGLIVSHSLQAVNHWISRTFAE